MSFISFFHITATLNMIICITDGLLFLLWKGIRKASYKRYKQTGIYLAIACFLFVINALYSAYCEHWHHEHFEFLNVRFILQFLLQSYLFTAALIALHTDQRLRKHHYYFLSLIFIFPLLFFISIHIYGYQPANHHTQFFQNFFFNVPYIIQLCFAIFSIILMIVYNRAFIIIRKEHKETVRRIIGHAPSSLWMNWSLYLFIALIIESIITLILVIYPTKATECLFRIITLAFYILYPIYYLQYGKIYERVKNLLLLESSNENQTVIESISKDNLLGMNKLLAQLYDRNNLLFEKLTHLMEEKKLYLNPEIKVEDIIHELGTNRTYLANAIRQNCQQTIGEYLLSLRLKHAQEMLLCHEKNTMKIEEIAFASGFNSLRTFNRNFKTYFALTPEEFKKTRTNSAE